MNTNVHTFQLAAVLIEAAEDEGQKKEAVIQRVKTMLSNAVKWLKEKLAKLIDFLKEKASKLEETFKKAGDYLKGLVERAKGSSKRVKYTKLNISSLQSNVTQGFLSMAKEISMVGLTINNSIFKSANPLEVDLAKVEEGIELATKKLNELLENIHLIKEEGKKELEGKLYDYIDMCRKGIASMISSYSQVKGAQQSNLDVMKKILAGLESSKSKINDSFNSTAMSQAIAKVTKLGSLITRAATSFWSFIAGLVGKIISGAAGAFRKKDPKAKEEETGKEGN